MRSEERAHSAKNLSEPLAIKALFEETLVSQPSPPLEDSSLPKSSLLRPVPWALVLFQVPLP